MMRRFKWLIPTLLIAAVVVLLGSLWSIGPGVSVSGKGLLSFETRVALAAIIDLPQEPPQYSYSPAYPVVAAISYGGETTNKTSHIVNLPANISAGDLLLMFFAITGAPTITFPEGWTELFETTHYSDNCVFGCWYRIADGGEGASITVITSLAKKDAYQSFRITGYSGTPEAGTSASGYPSYPNPPNLAPTWGALDTLWFAVETAHTNKPATAYPDNYTNGLTYGSNWSDAPYMGSARRELNAASEDPGTFTISGSAYWIANTVAVKPTEEEAPDISNIPTSHGFGIVQPSSTYWPNGAEPGWPLADGNCTFTVTNNSSFDINVLFSMGNLTGGTQWTPGAAPGSNIFTMKVCISGAINEGACTVLSATPQELISSLGAGLSEYWEIVFYTPTNDPFLDGVQKSGTITLAGEPA